MVKNNEKRDKKTNVGGGGGGGGGGWTMFFCPVLQRLEHSSKHWTEKQHSSTKEDKLFHFSSHFSLFIKIPSAGLEEKLNLIKKYISLLISFFIVFNCFTLTVV